MVYAIHYLKSPEDYIQKFGRLTFLTAKILTFLPPPFFFLLYNFVYLDAKYHFFFYLFANRAKKNESLSNICIDFDLRISKN